MHKLKHKQLLHLTKGKYHVMMGMDFIFPYQNQEEVNGAFAIRLIKNLEKWD